MEKYQLIQILPDIFFLITAITIGVFGYSMDYFGRNVTLTANAKIDPERETMIKDTVNIAFELMSILAIIGITRYYPYQGFCGYIAAIITRTIIYRNKRNKLKWQICQICSRKCGKYIARMKKRNKRICRVGFLIKKKWWCVNNGYGRFSGSGNKADGCMQKTYPVSTV